MGQKKPKGMIKSGHERESNQVKNSTSLLQHCALLKLALVHSLDFAA